MEATTKAQRRKANRKTSDTAVIRIEMKDGMGNPRWVTADLLDINQSGFGISLMVPLKTGSTIAVRGKLGEHRVEDKLKVGVRWCVEKADGSYRAGLEFLDAHSNFTVGEEQAASINPEVLDCYEVMQLSPNADQDTIARVYRMLALRYHPDNTETGNSEMFVRLSEAHQILSDPERRASYDARHQEAGKLRWKIFDQASATKGSEGEKRKRQGILALLYSKMLYNPEQAEMTIHLFEELLGVPREHLESALWYLKGKGLIKRGDNGRYSITVAGFDEAEAQRYTPSIPADRQLTEAH
jgi:hypothetical protein